MLAKEQGNRTGWFIRMQMRREAAGRNATSAPLHAGIAPSSSSLSAAGARMQGIVHAGGSGRPQLQHPLNIALHAKVVLALCTPISPDGTEPLLGRRGVWQAREGGERRVAAKARRRELGLRVAAARSGVSRSRVRDALRDTHSVAYVATGNKSQKLRA